jgi:hypothetical protein
LYWVADREVKFVEYWWNDTDREKTYVLGNNSSSTAIVYIKLLKGAEMVSKPVI